MKSNKEFITERLDDMALVYHGKFYADLHPDLQQAIWAMANRGYADYCGMLLDNTLDRIKDEVSKKKKL